LDNPAGLAEIRGTFFGLYCSNQFHLAELSTVASSVSFPTRTGNYSISYLTFGYSSFRQSQASLSYGKSMGKWIRAGIGVHYLSIRQGAGYQHLFALVPSVGLQLIPMKGITFGAKIFNPASQRFIPSGYQDVPAFFQAGIGYSMGDEVLICAEARKTAGEEVSYYGGAEITLQQIFLIRFGVSSGKMPGFSFGVGYRKNHMSLDLAATRHPLLGFSSGVGLGYAIK
jgi:hypothetical protein